MSWFDVVVVNLAKVETWRHTPCRDQLDDHSSVVLSADVWAALGPKQKVVVKVLGVLVTLMLLMAMFTGGGHHHPHPGKAHAKHHNEVHAKRSILDDLKEKVRPETVIALCSKFLLTSTESSSLCPIHTYPHMPRGTLLVHMLLEVCRACQ